MQRVFDVFPRAQFAAPAAVRELSGGVLGHAAAREQAAFLVTVLGSSPSKTT